MKSRADAGAVSRRAAPPRRRARLVCTAVALAAAFTIPTAASSVHNDGASFGRDRALEISQGVIGAPVTDHRLVRSDGMPVRLADYRGKPLVVSLIFTSCAHVCPTTTRHLYRAVAEARQALGSDSFQVVTIGFDTARDTPDVMADFARRQGVYLPGWDFLSADEPVMARLTAELGFVYYPAGGGFDHLIQTTVLDADGAVYRQIYGLDFRIPLFVEPLKELVFGVRTEQSLYESVANRIRLFCTVYDPASDSYRFSYAIFIGLAIGLALGVVAVIVVIREWRLTLLRRATP